MNHCFLILLLLITSARAEDVLTRRAGASIELPGLRPESLVLSPNGKWLLASGSNSELVVVPIPFDTNTLRIGISFQTNSDVVTNSSVEQLAGEAGITCTGLAVSPDSSRVFLSSSGGAIKIFTLGEHGEIALQTQIELPPALDAPGARERSTGLALSPDGKRLYAALHRSNRLGEWDIGTGKLRRLWKTGLGPCGVALTPRKLYVSNWRGPRPPSTSGTAQTNAIGSISVIDLLTEECAEIPAGFHPGAMALSSGGRYLAVANAGSDTVSIIDTRTDKTVETLAIRQGSMEQLRARPAALAFDSSDGKLLVSNESQNSVAVFDFAPHHCKLLGSIPVGWFPGALVLDSRRDALYVANCKYFPSPNPERSSSPYRGSLGLFKMPKDNQLPESTRAALALAEPD